MNKLLQRLDRHFVERKDCPALRDDINQPGITYGQLDQLSARIYGYLHDMGIGREDTVLLCLPRGIRIPIASIAVWKAGAAFVICEDTYAPERIEFIRGDCGCKLVITNRNWPEIINHDPLPGRQTVAPHDLAYIVYTSGTTGNPKGVMHEFGNLDESATQLRYKDEFLFRPEDKMALNAPMNFVAYQDYFNAAMYAGSSIFIVSYSYIKNPAALIELYGKVGVTCTFMTPSSFRLLPDMNPQMRWIVLGGEPCSHLYREGITLYNGYSMSEIGCLLGLFRVDRPYDITPIGRNYGGRELRVLSEDGQDMPVGQAGELCYENNFVRGYRNLPEKTAAAWHNGLFHSGDIVMKTESGDLILQGRNDDMIKINGNRIEPAEIEAASKKALPFTWVCAKGFSTPRQSFVVLYYQGDVAVDPAKMREELSRSLPYYMIPSYFVKIDEIPLLPNGKLNKKALAAPDINSYRIAYEAPATDIEKKICDVFARVLELDRVGVTEDFYELGGDSLRSMEAMMQLQDLGVEVSHIYHGRTARNIAAALAAQAGTDLNEDERNLHALQHPQPLSPIQVYMFDYQLYVPMSTMYNMPNCWRFSRENVSASRLADALHEVLAVHPVFRTVLRYDEDFNLVQCYDESMDIGVAVEHVSENRMNFILPQLIEPFMLLEQPMYRVRLFETEKHVYLFVDLHHIISDGTSLQVFSDDLTAAYRGEELPPDQFYLFMRDRQKFTQTEEYRKAQEYFDSTYDQKQWVNVVPPEIQSREGGYGHVTLPLNFDREALGAYLEKADLSATAFFEAVGLLTLARFEKADDVMVNWTYHGRDTRRKERAIGLMVNCLPLAVSITELTDIRSLYDSVKQQINAAIMHRDYPYSLEHTDVAVNDTLQIIDEGDLLEAAGLQGVGGESVHLPIPGLAMGKLMLITLFNRRGIEMRLNYTDTRYHAETMQNFSETYRSIANTLLKADPTTALRDIL